MNRLRISLSSGSFVTKPKKRYDGIKITTMNPRKVRRPADPKSSSESSKGTANKK